jgi:hypothetical protein
VNPEIVINQVNRYNDPNDKDGHLYGAIIASVNEYRETVEIGKYAEYHIAFCAHYITDLSQPFHNIVYDDFNESRHKINDGIVEDEVFQNIDEIRKQMYPISLRPDTFVEDLAREISRIVNLSRNLGHKLKRENRNMTKEEAYRQLGHSASLLRAVLRNLGKVDTQTMQMGDKK